jgi:peptidoglycan/xylan/chitin deacetylase (PgdA/CDA1 family)
LESEFALLPLPRSLDTDLSRTCQPPFGDVDDRIRAIAQGLGLRTVLWKYDSNDWRVGSDGTSEDDVDNYYNTLIKDAENGKFASVRRVLSYASCGGLSSLLN